MSPLRIVVALLLPLFIAALPFLFRPDGCAAKSAAAPPAADADRLVIVTPHSTPIRYEFERAFRKLWREAKGRDVVFDWRSVGGTNDIVRHIDDRYETEFRLLWESEGGEWTPEVARSFRDPQSDSEARRRFLASNVGIGIDLFFGGGTYDHARFANMGYGVDAGAKERAPETFRHIPQTFAGETIYDPQGRFYGVFLSSFGIAYSPERIRELGVPPPETWRDLRRPEFFGTLALADPTKSGSIAKCFEMMIQTEMLARAKENPSDPDAWAEGWLDGFALVKGVAANARSVTDSAGKIVRDISSGEAAAGICIDFYGFSEASWNRRMSGRPRLVYVMPENGTATTSDPVQLLRGAPHAEVAKAFIDFLLSEDGARILLQKPGTPGGPERHALLRASVRNDMLRKIPKERLSLPDYDPYRLAGAFEYRGEWTGRWFRLIRVLVKCVALDPLDDLRAAQKRIVEAKRRGDDAEASRLEAMVYGPESMPMRCPGIDAEAAREASFLSGSPAESAAARRRWTEIAMKAFRRAAHSAGNRRTAHGSGEGGAQ